MSARIPRRSFASPFVVTLAASCGAGTQASNPPGPPQPPPGPVTTSGDPSATTTTQPDEPPTANPPGPHENPPAPAKEVRWTVTKVKGEPDCNAFLELKCPPSAPGQPQVMCNPPAPLKYACPDGLGDGGSLQIVLRAGATDCYVDYGPIKCPPNASCNPPRPRKVDCPPH